MMMEKKSGEIQEKDTIIPEVERRKSGDRKLSLLGVAKRYLDSCGEDGSGFQFRESDSMEFMVEAFGLLEVMRFVARGKISEMISKYGVLLNDADGLGILIDSRTLEIEYIALEKKEVARCLAAYISDVRGKLSDSLENIDFGLFLNQSD